MANTRTPVQSTYQQNRIPFYGEMDSRDYLDFQKDQIFENVYCEAQVNQLSGQKEMFVQKRPGMLQTFSQENKEVRGTLSFEGRVFYTHGNEVIEIVANTRVSRFTIGSSTGKVGMTVFPYQGDDQTYLVVADGNQLNFFNVGTNTFVGDIASGYPVPHVPSVFVIDGYLILAKLYTGDVYNSQLEDLSVWDFLEAEMYPDTIRTISRYNNYIAVMGTKSVEFFYDAAIEDGSPFARNDSFVCPIGCASAGSVVQLDQRLIWVGQTEEGGRSIWMMTETKPSEISNTFIKEALDTEGSLLLYSSAYTVRVAGKHFYVLVLSTGTFAFDLRDKVWVRWYTQLPEGFPRFTGDDELGYPFLITNTRVAKFDPNYYQDAGQPIICYWQTSLLDFNTMNRKVANRLSLVGDIPPQDPQILVQWTDNDYNTFNTGRIINLGTPRAALVNMGYFRKRAYRFSYSGNAPLRMFAMELTYNLGTN